MANISFNIIGIAKWLGISLSTIYPGFNFWLVPEPHYIVVIFSPLLPKKRKIKEANIGFNIIIKPSSTSI